MMASEFPLRLARADDVAALEAPIPLSVRALQSAARIRAFFVLPTCARRGIGRSIMRASEQAIRTAGFRAVDIVATLAGEPLYATFGYAAVERYEIALAGGLRLPVVRMGKRLDVDG